MIDVEVVVARYRENLDWLQQLSLAPHSGIHVYDQSPRLTEYVTNEKMIVTQLSNNSPGHEAYSYLAHIIDSYPFFPDVTFFVQGNPFDHTPNIVDLIYATEREEYTVNGFDWLVDHWLVCDGNGCPHHCNLPIGRVYEGLFNEPFPADGLPFVPGAQFAVTREQLISRSHAFYVDVARKMETDYQQWYCWSLERLWKKLFTGDHRKVS